MPLRPLNRLRRICLALPQAYEQETWGEATFRIRGKIFVVAREDDDGVATFSCKAPPGSQFVLVNAEPERFTVPPYVGHKGLSRHAARRQAGLGGAAGVGRISGAKAGAVYDESRPVAAPVLATPLRP